MISYLSLHQEQVLVMVLVNEVTNCKGKHNVTAT
jgi:hypothetical protein